MNWNIEDHIIFEAIVGSHLYGTSTSESDKDYRGVCIPPWEVQNSLLVNFEQKDAWGEEFKDRVIYNLKKFMMLCMDANPAILELLFILPAFQKRWTPEWQEIIENREIFISKKVRYTFSGYAHAQLKRIRTHRNWLLNPPKQEPTREGFSLPANPRLSSEQISAVVSLPTEVFVSEYREEAEKEKHYREAKVYWDLYMNWKKNRNPQRAELEEKYGYDTKHAMQLVRLMNEGEELLLTGNITFPRPERDDLLSVRKGNYTYDQLMEMVGSFDVLFETLYEKSTLPHDPDRVKVNLLYQKLLQDVGQGVGDYEKKTSEI